MLGWISIYAAVAAVLVGGWYSYFLRYNRRRSRQALRWIEMAFEGHGKVVGVHWAAPSRFHVQLRLGQNLFQHASLMVQLVPREFPFAWIAAKLHKQREMLTFESDLDFPPEFNLDVQNQRWCGRTQRHFPKATAGWHMERTAPFMITTRREWQDELIPMMDALVASRERDFVNVSYRRTSPHFSASVPLDAIAPEAPSCSDFFDVLRELAGGASASRP